MSKTLQRNGIANVEPFEPVWPNEIIIDSDYCDAVVGLLSAARSEVRLCAYAWRWYENEPELAMQKINTALLRLKMRGVHVRALVDTESMRETFATLGFNVRSVVNTRMLHTKAISADSFGLILGSHNLTKRATTDNYEMSILAHEFQIVDSFNNYFDRLWDSRG